MGEPISFGRRDVGSMSVRVKCSPLGAVDNFLDTARFRFIHTDILAAKPDREAGNYQVKIREDVDEV